VTSPRRRCITHARGARHPAPPHAVRRLRRVALLDVRIDRLQRRCVARHGVLSLAGGLPAAETFPAGALTRALERSGTEPLQYDWPEGRQPLRQWIAERLSARGASVAADDVLITSGAQQALVIAAELCAHRGQAMDVPDACYPAALELFEARGLVLRSPEEAAESAYTMPAIGNPTGLALGPAERSRALAHGKLVVEDDAYADLRFDGHSPRPLLAEAPERVFHVGTFSKTLCPGLRVGWLVAPARYRRAARQAKQRYDLQTSGLSQRLIEGYLEEQSFDERLTWLRTYYARRAERLSCALRRRLPSFSFRAPEGGFSLWAVSEEPGDDVALLALAQRYGVSFDPGRNFRRSGRSEPIALRLTFSSIPEQAIDEAVTRLTRAWRAFTQS
jgi:2-aminoadipate transaminase